MSRVSSLVFGSVLVGLLGIAASGCQAQLTVKTKTRFVENDVPADGSGAAWGGGPISIDIKGVGVAVNGGVKVTSDATDGKVTAKARMLAFAFAEEKANADMSIAEAKGSFKVFQNNNGITVECAHGGGHGSSDSGSSGCELVDIHVPPGTDMQKLDIKVLSGNGDLTLQLNNAIISNVEANANGAGPTLNTDLPATVGGSISMVNEDGDVAVKLPGTWAADSVVLGAPANKIHVGAATDVTAFDGSQGHGQKGTGLKLLRLTAKSPFDDKGHITLQ